ncbi:MAG: hypothetical protein K6C10_10425 [Prevotella sp.]|nr:hypothetical protein [Prevotella sp.]
MKGTIAFIVLITCVLSGFANSGVEVKINPIEIMIGEQTLVEVKVHAAENDKVEFPTFQPRQMLVEGVEVIAVQKPDANTMLLTLTSFDGKLYYLPPFKVKVNGKTQESKNLALKVTEMEVDTTKLDKFFGPKDVQDNPFMWSDWSLSFWLSVLMLLMLALAYYLYLRLRDNKPIIARIKIIKRLLPHQKAMQEIDQIKADKMVSSENQKEYYTKLTDTLRKYIEERYGFSAMEMTSTEIIDRLVAAGDQKSLEELRQLFITADLVKFAKYSTMINENDANLVNAIDFINQTKLENQPTEETVKPQLSEEDQRSQKMRRVLKVVIWGVIGLATLLFCYVAYSVYQLIN